MSRFISTLLAGCAGALLTLAAVSFHPPPAEAQSVEDPMEWCRGPRGNDQANYDYEARMDRYNTLAIMTANIWVVLDAEERISGPNEEQAREQACRILYNTYHWND